jgi:hypothetical protein
VGRDTSPEKMAEVFNPPMATGTAVASPVLY